jgi:hypothetical protein
MARGGGFLSRVRNAIRNVVAPRPSEPPREQPPREQPPRFRDPYRKTWRQDHGKGSYSKNLAVFRALVDPVESDPDEKLALWDSYIRHINRGEGRYRRQSPSNMFWRDSGIDPSSLDWRRWRIAMGYVGKRRSRS